MSAEYDVEFATNRLGLRNDEVGPKRGFRVLLLGDSFTCGYGVRRRRRSPTCCGSGWASS